MYPRNLRAPKRVESVESPEAMPDFGARSGDPFMLTPTTTRDWIALLVISALGIGALVWLMPLSARVPFVMPPAMYNNFDPIKKPFSGLMNFTPIVVGLVLVTLCLLLYGGWMSWSTSHPVMRPARQARGEE
jgi:hypothetical protein